ALKKGQFPRSAEVQTVFVLLAGMLALMFTGQDTWRLFTVTFTGTLGHLHEFSLGTGAMQSYAINASLVFAKCVWPLVLAVMLAGLLAGGLQARFQTASEALSINWGRISPGAGFKRVFS